MRVLSGVVTALAVVIAPMAAAQQQGGHPEHAQKLDQLILQLEQIGDQRLRGNVSEQEYAEYQDIIQRLRAAKAEEEGAGAKMIPGDESLAGVESAGQPQGVTLKEVVLRKSQDQKLTAQQQEPQGRQNARAALSADEAATALREGRDVRAALNDERRAHRMNAAEISDALDEGDTVRILIAAPADDPAALMQASREIEQALGQQQLAQTQQGQQRAQDQQIQIEETTGNPIDRAVAQVQGQSDQPQQRGQQPQQDQQQQTEWQQRAQDQQTQTEERSSDPFDRAVAQVQGQSTQQQQRGQQPHAQSQQRPQDQQTQTEESSGNPIDRAVAQVQGQSAQQPGQQQGRQFAQDQSPEQQPAAQSDELLARLEQLLADREEAAARDQQRRQGEQQARVQQPNVPQIGDSPAGQTDQIAVKFQNPQLRQQFTEHQNQRVNLVATIDTENGQTVARIESVSPAGNN